MPIDEHEAIERRLDDLEKERVVFDKTQGIEIRVRELESLLRTVRWTATALASFVFLFGAAVAYITTNAATGIATAQSVIETTKRTIEDDNVKLKGSQDQFTESQEKIDQSSKAIAHDLAVVQATRTEAGKTLAQVEDAQTAAQKSKDAAGVALTKAIAALASADNIKREFDELSANAMNDITKAIDSGSKPAVDSAVLVKFAPLQARIDNLNSQITQLTSSNSVLRSDLDAAVRQLSESTYIVLSYTGGCPDSGMIRLHGFIPAVSDDLRRVDSFVPGNIKAPLMEGITNMFWGGLNITICVRRPPA
jgi:hypothetical protein